MGDQLIPFIYVVTISFAALALYRFVRPAEAPLERQHFVLVGCVYALAFFAGHYLLFMMLAAVAILKLTPAAPVARIHCFLFLLPLLPTLELQLDLAGIPLFDLNWSRMLTLVLLVPLVPACARPPLQARYPVDKYVVLFCVITSLLLSRDASITAGLRTLFVTFLDVFIPYYVLSRSLRSQQDIRAALYLFIAALTVVAAMNVFETARQWHIFGDMIRDLTGRFGGFYEWRAGFLRAYGPMDKPSASAFALATGIALVCALAPRFTSSAHRAALITVMAAGLLVTFSRGSWLAAGFVGAGYLIFIASPGVFIRNAALLMAIVVPLLSFSDLGSRIVAILPVIGSDTSQAAATIDYRQSLLATGLQVAHENPLLGSVSFQSHPDLLAMVGGSGFLDLVNHYLVMLLNFGYVGLLSFVAIFASTLLLLRRTVKSLRPGDPTRDFGKTLILTVLGLMLALATTSAAGRVGLILWCLVAMSCAFSHTVALSAPSGSRRRQRSVRDTAIVGG